MKLNRSILALILVGFLSAQTPITITNPDGSRYKSAASQATTIATPLEPKQQSAAYTAIGFQPLATDQGPVTPNMPLPPRAFFVATDGSDSAPGTITEPFLTPAHAQAAMKRSSVKTTVLRGGTYKVPATLAYVWNDVGETWMPYSGETPVLDFGGAANVTITGVNGAPGITFEGLTFANMAAPGIFHNGAVGPVYRWNTFLNCNQYCVSGHTVNGIIFDSNIINGQSPGNWTDNTGQAYGAVSMCCAIANGQFTHNLVENTEGGAIGISNSEKSPPDNNNTIDRNLLVNVANNVVDYGALYLHDLSHASTGNTITNNVVISSGGTNGVANSVGCLYLDDLLSNAVVSGNVCRNFGAYGIIVHGGDHNLFVNNLFDLSEPGSILGLYQSSSNAQLGMGSNSFTRNVVYALAGVSNPLWRLIQVGPDVPSAVAKNMYFSRAGAAIPNTIIVDDSPVIGIDPGLGAFNPTYCTAHAGVC